MRWLATIAALAAAACTQPRAAEPVPADEAPEQQGRIWKGTLGTQAITACFFEERPGTGVFYDDGALVPIRLEAESDTAPQTLREMQGYDDPTGAVWTLTFGEDRISGERRKGAEAVPIRLTPQPAERPEGGSACESGAFLDPVLAGGTLTSKRESLDGTAYTVLDYRGPQRSGLEEYGVTSFALDPARPGDEAINLALAKALPDGTASHPAGQCLAGSLSWSSGQGDYGHFLKPDLITPRWVSVTSSGSSFCGGAHPNHFTGVAVYDRDSGAEIDPATWFAPGALRFYDWEPGAGQMRPIAGLSASLLRAVLARWPVYAAEGADGVAHRAECLDMARDHGWQIGLTREGPVFVPQFPYVAFACTGDIVLPWQDARPFLSAEGRAVMARLR